MTYYDYKVVPAPRRARKVKGVAAGPDLFALTLTEAINEVARQGWEYYRSEALSMEGPAGWVKRASVEEQTMLIFRRPREHLSPRLAAAPAETGAPREPLEPGPRLAELERPAFERPVPVRREPSRVEPRVSEDSPTPVTPLRPGPRLGPAEKS
ncbi:MAG: hypothetical protein ABTQ27_03435 [Amaricoccus sp.]|uniref:hypothetical protein n=1 Tax=Amaricoccus sp. TaxID=1872485 RepID=UPI0033153B9B